MKTLPPLKGRAKAERKHHHFNKAQDYTEVLPGSAGWNLPQRTLTRGPLPRIWSRFTSKWCHEYRCDLEPKGTLLGSSFSEDV